MTAAKTTMVFAPTLDHAKQKMAELGITEYREWGEWVEELIPEALSKHKYMSIADFRRVSVKLTSIYRQKELPNLITTMDHYTPTRDKDAPALERPLPINAWYLYDSVWAHVDGEYRNVRSTHA